MDVDEGVRGQRGHAGGDGRQQEDPGRLVGAGTSHLLVNSLSPHHFSDIICKFAGNLLAFKKLNFLSFLRLQCIDPALYGLGT